MSFTWLGYCNFRYGNLVVCFGVGSTTIDGYHGGINMYGSNVGHPNDLTCGLNGGPLGGFPLTELPRNESPNCPPFHG